MTHAMAGALEVLGVFLLAFAVLLGVVGTLLRMVRVLIGVLRVLGVECVSECGSRQSLFFLLSNVFARVARGKRATGHPTNATRRCSISARKYQ